MQLTRPTPRRSSERTSAPSAKPTGSGLLSRSTETKPPPRRLVQGTPEWLKARETYLRKARTEPGFYCCAEILRARLTELEPIISHAEAEHFSPGPGLSGEELIQREHRLARLDGQRVALRNILAWVSSGSGSMPSIWTPDEARATSPFQDPDPFLGE